MIDRGLCLLVFWHGKPLHEVLLGQSPSWPKQRHMCVLECVRRKVATTQKYNIRALRRCSSAATLPQKKQPQEGCPEATFQRVSVVSAYVQRSVHPANQILAPRMLKLQSCTKRFVDQ